METWLSDDTLDNELAVFDYQLHRLDCGRHGGGILFDAHHSFTCKVLLQGDPYNLEFLSLSVFPQSLFLSHTS